MDGPSLSSEKSDKYIGFLNYAQCWTLKQDIELKDALQGTVSGMLDAIRHFETVGKALEAEMELFECRFENIHSRIGCLKMERLVKEQVDEVPVDLLRGRSQKSREYLAKEINREEYEQRTISTISSAIQRGFELFNSTTKNDQQQQLEQDQHCSAIGADTAQNGDPSDPSSSSTAVPQNKPAKGVNALEGMEMLRSFELSELPPIIGTAEFYESLTRRANERKTDSPTAKVQRMRGNGPTPSTETPTTAATTKIEEEDIASVSSGRSAPPQDPVVVVVVQQLPSTGTAERAESGATTLTLRTVLIEEIAERARKREENGRNETERDEKKRDIDQQIPRVEEKQRTGERHGARGDNEQQQRAVTIVEQQRGEERATEKRSSNIGQNKVMAENAQRQRENAAERERTKENTDQRQRIATMKGREHHVKKSLFSSSSEEESEEEEEGEEEAFHILVKSKRPILQNRGQKLANDPSSSLGRSLSQRPLSAQSIGSSAGDVDELLFTSADRAVAVGHPPPALVRKTESATAVSVVSNNEEFGPASVRNRIAQIGAQIPVGRRSMTTDAGRREEDEHRRRSGGGSERAVAERGTAATTEAPTTRMAPLPTEAVKTRAKAPSARRAPSQRIAAVSGRPPVPPSTSSSSSAVGYEAITGAAAPQPSQQQRRDGEKRPASRGTMKGNDFETKVTMMTSQRTPGTTNCDDEAEEKQQQPVGGEKPPPVHHSVAKSSRGSAAGQPQSGPRTTPAKAVAVPPPVTPRTAQRSSIFSSSSSDDDLGFSKVIGTAKGRLPPPPPHQQQQPHKRNEVPTANATTALPTPKQQQHPPPFNYKKTAASAKTRKGLFDDSESDF